MDALTPTPRLKIFGAQAQLHCVAPGSSNSVPSVPPTTQPALTSRIRTNLCLVGLCLVLLQPQEPSLYQRERTGEA